LDTNKAPSGVFGHSSRGGSGMECWACMILLYSWAALLYASALLYALWIGSHMVLTAPCSSVLVWISVFKFLLFLIF
jgi:hypothetical protein